MSIFNVSPKKEKALLERMRELNVNEEDIEEKFIRSSGPGGQKTNKTSSCVCLHHKPTDITVKRPAVWAKLWSQGRKRNIL